METSPVYDLHTPYAQRRLLGPIDQKYAWSVQMSSFDNYIYFVYSLESTDSHPVKLSLSYTICAVFYI